MLSAMFAFFAGVLLSWPAIVAFVLFGILFEHYHHRGWAVFTALVVAAISYFYFAIPLSTILIGTAVYIGIGLVWSFWRYKRHADKVVAETKDKNASAKQFALDKLHPKAMLPTITAWIIIWPFSMVENLVGDIINVIQQLVEKIFRGVYHRIYIKAVAALTQ